MNISTQPLVSVVTPVYNGEKYIAECIESVLAQTYQNWEYIIVDNCSTDGTPGIIQRYTQKDKRIQIHNNTEFVSAIENHHIAFHQISLESKYCKVVHADDWLFPECIEKMVVIPERFPSVGIVGAYRLDGVRVNLDGLPYSSEIVSGRQICRDTLLGGPYTFGSPSSLLIRSENIRKRLHFYDENNFSNHADTAACYEILQDQDFGFVHQVLTFTRRHKKAQTNRAIEINSYIWAHFMVLKKYGPIYLRPEEYEICIKNEKDKYYRFMAKGVFQKKGRKFWDYHKDKMFKLEIPFSRIKLLQSLLLEFMDIMLDQKRAISGITRRLQTVKRLDK